MLEQPKVSHLVHNLRRLMKLSQEQFAATLGVAFSTINRWENVLIQPSLALQIKTMLNELSRSPILKLQEQSQTLIHQYFSSDVESNVR